MQDREIINPRIVAAIETLQANYSFALDPAQDIFNVVGRKDRALWIIVSNIRHFAEAVFVALHDSDARWRALDEDILERAQQRMRDFRLAAES